jgi:hypothetical protein
VYDAYKAQRSACAIEEKDSILLTNTQHSEKKDEVNPE